MNILVLGGSYFLGKCFVYMARSEHKITVFNRGNRPLNLSEVREIYGDRHEVSSLEKIKGQSYDAVIDFCAYEKGDIARIFETLHGKMKQYIFISTCDVYERGRNQEMDENGPMEYRSFPGEAGTYISGKVALERELEDCGDKFKIPHTSIRPAFIYGPDNYAPREGIYFHWIETAGQVLVPENSDGEFQMVYVEDVAKAILKCIGNPKFYNESWNLAPKPMVTYESFCDALEKAGMKQFERVPVSISVINEKGIPLPFPLTRAESNWYNGEKAVGLIGQYTDLTDGLKRTAASLNQK